MPVATNPFDELARYVAHERKRKKLTIEKVAKSLVVPPSTIRSLENEEETDIPVSNAPGLYRRYGALLKIPKKELDTLLSVAEAGESGWRRRGEQRVRNQVFLSNIGRGFAVSVVIAIIAAYALWQLLVLTSAPRRTQR